MTPSHQTVKKGSQPAGTSYLGDSPSCGLTLITSQYISFGPRGAGLLQRRARAGTDSHCLRRNSLDHRLSRPLHDRPASAWRLA